MPEEERSDAAPRPPGFGHGAQRLFGGALIGREHAPGLHLDGKVSGREGIGAALGEKEVDFGRPAPDPLDGRHKPDRFLVVGRESMKRKRTVDHMGCEALRIAVDGRPLHAQIVAVTADREDPQAARG